MMRYNTSTNAIESYVAGAWSNTVTASYTTNILAVAGGGNGGYGGGAGGGGVIFSQGQQLIAGLTYTVTVGAGGSVAPAGNAGTNGNPTIFGNFTALGGGGGNNNVIGIGSGGGNYSGPNGNFSSTIPGTLGQGNPGGAGYFFNGFGSPPNIQTGGGGGGAGASGANGGTNQYGASGNAGAGIQYNISGTNVTYAGGGGGGGTSSNNASSGNPLSYNGSGGTGGGGAGGVWAQVGVNGTANTGGGGGAGGYGGSWYTGGAGGSGVLILSYIGPQRGTGGTVTSSGGYTIHTFTSSSFYIA
jgi:hypothetical protein